MQIKMLQATTDALLAGHDVLILCEGPWQAECWAGDLAAALPTASVRKHVRQVTVGTATAQFSWPTTHMERRPTEFARVFVGFAAEVLD